MSATEHTAKAANLLMRTKGWAKTVCLNYLNLLSPPELQALVELEDEPGPLGDRVSAVIDEVEDRISAEESLRKQKEKNPVDPPMPESEPV